MTVLAGLLFVFPYLAHRLLAVEYPDLRRVLIFPLLATLVESWNALPLALGDGAPFAFPAGLWLTAAQGAARALPDVSVAGVLGVVFLVTLTAAALDWLWQRLQPLEA